MNGPTTKPVEILQRDGAQQEIERLLLELRRLVLVRAILAQRCASDAEIEAHDVATDRVRAKLAFVVARSGAEDSVAG